MLKAIKNFQKIKTVFIVVLVIAIIIFVFLVIAVNAIGSYVQDNYIVVNKHSRVQGKQAFVREYTIATGDDTLAKIAGVDVFEERSVTFDASNLEWGDGDYRNVVKHIAGTWIQQGLDPSQSRARDIYEGYMSNTSLGDKKPEEILDTLKTEFEGISSGTFTGLYTTADEPKSYDFKVKTESFSVQSYRCCCCLAESFCDYLCHFDKDRFGYSPKGHTGVIGLSTSAADAGDKSTEKKDCKEGSTTKRRVCFIKYTATSANGNERHIGLDLYNKIYTDRSIVDKSLRELKGSKYLQPGMIITYVTKIDSIPEACRHVEVITYIDDNYVYLAGAGSDLDIFMNAVVGYNSVVPLDETYLDGLDGACDNTLYVGNIINWYESQSVTGTN